MTCSGDLFKRAVELLRKLERVQHEDSAACWYECPSCHATSGYYSKSGHYRDCDLQAFLEETKDIKIGD